MYIKRIHDEYIGPITKADIVFPFNEDGTPKPVILVGENGSGKSTLLSNIVDAFYMLADKEFSNAMMSSGEGIGKQYYKMVSPIEIKDGGSYLLSFIQFDNPKTVSYIFKSGQISVDEVKSKIIGLDSLPFSWNHKERNFKKINSEKEDAKEAFQKSVICFFGSDRYEKPFWQGDKYYNQMDNLHPSIKDNVSGMLYCPISVTNAIQSNVQWLIDVIVDSRPDVILNQNGQWSFSKTNITDLILLSQAKTGIERLLCAILGKGVYISLNYRNQTISRLKIIENGTNRVVAPTFDSLSTGQITLFNMFATIIKYADINDINKSFSLGEITGIVIIDEIELHLHTQLQKEVLPKLIKLFPKVQFVITSHSPLFLLGMQEEFGDEGFEIYNMPDAEKIDVERFSEFQRAYEYFKNSATYQKETEKKLKKAISEIIQRKETEALVITEGATDWKHIKTAFAVLSKSPENKDVFDHLYFKFLEYVPVATGADDELVIEMGNASLRSLCESYAKIPNDKKYIFIADRDDDITNRKLSVSGKKFKNWGNNVYSFVLPIPDHRKTTPNICIEHLYTDEEIKTEIECSGVKRRLYMGCEFDNRGIAFSINRVCENKNCCGTGKIRIIEGSSGGRVTSLENEDGTNYALPKMDFANYVTEHPDEFNFDSFLEVSRIIKEILSEGETNA